jgi:hypothetical protein
MKQTIVNALRKATDVSLSIDSYEISLIPHARVKKPGGAYALEAQPPRPPQLFAVEPVTAALSGITGTSGGVVGSEGAQAHSWSYELVGKYNAVMEIGDTWDNGGTTYRVIAIQPFNNYEKRGVVEAIGKDPAYGS